MANKRQMRRHRDRLNQAPDDAEVSEVLARMDVGRHHNRATLERLWADTKAGNAREPLTRLYMQFLEHGRGGESLEDFKRRYGL